MAETEVTLQIERNPEFKDEDENVKLEMPNLEAEEDNTVSFKTPLNTQTNDVFFFQFFSFYLF